ncbi:hypothetical protein [Cryptosporangium sp. NPDC048952]|uniref:hypothetical protein n=1 Tax=Cryptosporangium sp. NPDC048952 TaxID=3363961 RepID=UPI003718E11D
MRWVKAALLLIGSLALAGASYVVLDNIAVPAAIAIIGVIVACMSVALGGSDDGAAPVANPRAGGSVRSQSPNRVLPQPADPTQYPPQPQGYAQEPAQAYRQEPGYHQGHVQGYPQAPQQGWGPRVDPDEAAWREAQRR